MLIDELQKANIEALKSQDKNARSILTIVISKYKAAIIELRAQGKEPSDVDVIKVISKTIKELEEEREGYAKAGRQETVEAIDAQKALLEKYLPKMLSEEEIRNIIATLEDKSMPSVMRHFKTNYDGQVDMSLVSKIARG